MERCRRAAGWTAIGLFGWCLAVETGAAEVSFPYEATVSRAEEVVRCGPGTKFYVTSQLKRGDVVTVVQHDAGGWCRLRPPQGSFSWIPAESVDVELDGSSGVVNIANTPVRVGTELGDSREVFQKKLSKGDRVEILGEKSFASDSGLQKMLKIAPPAGEFRWISIKSIKAMTPNDDSFAFKNSELQSSEGSWDRPSGKGIRLASGSEEGIAFGEERDPFREADTISKNSRKNPPLKELKPETAAEPATRRESASSNDAIRKRLIQLDEEMQAMLAAEPKTWNLNAWLSGIWL